MKANFKINEDDEESKNNEVSIEEKNDTSNEEFIKKGMNVWTYRSKSTNKISDT